MRPIATLPALTADAPDLARWGGGLDAETLLEIGADTWLLTIRDGAVTRVRPGPFVMRAYDLAIRCDPAAWARFLAPDPEPGWHDLMALRRRGVLVAEGDLPLFFAHLQWFKVCFALLRAAA